MIGKVDVFNGCHTEGCPTTPTDASNLCVDCQERLDKLGKGLVERFNDACVGLSAQQQSALQLFLLKSTANWWNAHQAATTKQVSAYEEFLR